MSYIAYKNIHLLGIFMIVLSYGALLARSTADKRIHRRAAITHGFGVLLALVAGFGMLAKLGIHWPYPSWVISKLLIWLLLAFGIAPAKRLPSLSGTFWWVVILLATVASLLAIYKPA